MRPANNKPEEYLKKQNMAAQKNDPVADLFCEFIARYELFPAEIAKRKK